MKNNKNNKINLNIKNKNNNSQQAGVWWRMSDLESAGSHYHLDLHQQQQHQRHRKSALSDVGGKIDLKKLNFSFVKKQNKNKKNYLKSKALVWLWQSEQCKIIMKLINAIKRNAIIDATLSPTFSTLPFPLAILCRWIKYSAFIVESLMSGQKRV